MLILKKAFFYSLQIVKLGSTLVSKHVIFSSTKEYEWNTRWDQRKKNLLYPGERKWRGR